MAERYKPSLANFAVSPVDTSGLRSSARMFQDVGNQLSQISNKAFKIEKQRIEIEAAEQGAEAADQAGQDSEALQQSLPQDATFRSQVFREAAGMRFMATKVVGFDQDLAELQASFANDPDRFNKEADVLRRRYLDETPVEARDEMAKTLSRKVGYTSSKVIETSANAAREETKEFMEQTFMVLQNKMTQAQSQGNIEMYEEAVAEMSQLTETVDGTIIPKGVGQIMMQKAMQESQMSSVMLEAMQSKNPTRVLEERGMATPENNSRALSLAQQQQSFVQAEENRIKAETKRQRLLERNDFYMGVIDDPSAFDPAKLQVLQREQLAAGASSDEIEAFSKQVYDAAAGNFVESNPNVLLEIDEAIANNDPEAGDIITENAHLLAPDDRRKYEERLRTMASDVFRSNRVKDKLASFYTRPDVNLVVFDNNAIPSEGDRREALLEHNRNAVAQRAEIEADLAKAFDEGEVTVNGIEDWLNQRMLQTAGGANFTSQLASTLAGGDSRAKVVYQNMFGESMTVTGLGRGDDGMMTTLTVEIPKAEPDNLPEVADSMRKALQSGASVPFSKQDVIILEKYIEGMRSGR